MLTAPRPATLGAGAGQLHATPDAGLTAEQKQEMALVCQRSQRARQGRQQGGRGAQRAAALPVAEQLDATQQRGRDLHKLSPEELARVLKTRTISQKARERRKAYVEELEAKAAAQEQRIQQLESKLAHAELLGSMLRRAASTLKQSRAAQLSPLTPAELMQQAENAGAAAAAAAAAAAPAELWTPGVQSPDLVALPCILEQTVFTPVLVPLQQQQQQQEAGVDMPVPQMAGQQYDCDPAVSRTNSVSRGVTMPAQQQMLQMQQALSQAPLQLANLQPGSDASLLLSREASPAPVSSHTHVEVPAPPPSCTQQQQQMGAGVQLACNPSLLLRDSTVALFEQLQSQQQSQQQQEQVQVPQSTQASQLADVQLYSNPGVLPGPNITALTAHPHSLSQQPEMQQQALLLQLLQQLEEEHGQSSGFCGMATSSFQLQQGHSTSSMHSGPSDDTPMGRVGSFCDQNDVVGCPWGVYPQSSSGPAQLPTPLPAAQLQQATQQQQQQQQQQEVQYAKQAIKQQGQYQAPHVQQSAVEQGLSMTDAMLHTVPEGMLPVSPGQGSSGDVHVVPLLPDWVDALDLMDADDAEVDALLCDLDLHIPAA